MVQENVKKHQNQKISITPVRTIEGKVLVGAHLGRTIGIPTANLNPELVNDQAPDLSYGVYSCIVKYNHHQYLGAFYFGPIWRDEKVTLTAEVHIFDFNRELYHQSIVIEIKEFLRSPLRFQSIGKMQRQIELDINQVRNTTQLS